jgi:hypothetical protein
MRVLFINQFDDTSNDGKTNYDFLNECVETTIFFINNNIKVHSVYSSNNYLCLKIAENIFSKFDGIKFYLNFELGEFNKRSNNSNNSDIKNQLENTINLFDFCLMNSSDNQEKYQNVIDKKIW